MIHIEFELQLHEIISFFASGLETFSTLLKNQIYIVQGIWEGIFKVYRNKLRKTRYGKEGKWKKISLLTLSSVHEKALGKDGVCRVAYLGHSLKSFMAPPIVYDLEMGKK